MAFLSRICWMKRSEKVEPGGFKHHDVINSSERIMKEKVIWIRRKEESRRLTDNLDLDKIM